ncbi:MAG: hypothetical protein SGJ26_04275 [Nitrospirota bacterium]|nr:hypothetical protein [Nitrospirota bacterium]
MMLLREWWRWFKRQSRLNKVIIVSLVGSLVLFLIPLIVSWLKPTPIHVGVAFYTYERAFQVGGNTKTYFYENRNLVSDCSLRRVEQALPRGRAKTPDPQSWVVSKFLLENMTSQSLTKFRMGFKSPLVRPTTTIFTTPNVTATGAWETTKPDAPQMYVVSMTSLPPMTSAVLSLKTPIDESVRQFVYMEHGRVTVQVPFLSADQFETFPLKISRLNSMQILNRETVLRAGDETFANEKIEVTMLPADEPNLKEDATSYQLLPKARTCEEGTAGDW